MKRQDKHGSDAYPWYIVIISATLGCSISAGFPQFSMTISQLALRSGMSESFLLTGDTVKSAAIVAAMLLSGFTYKRFGVRWNMILSILCTVLPQFLIPFVSSPAMFLFLKIMQGFASLCFPVLLLVIMDVIKKEQTGLATAVFNGIFYSGGGVGGIIAGVFIAKSGWISSYFALGIIMFLLGAIWLVTVKTHDISSDTDEENVNESAGQLSVLLKMPVTWLLILAFLSTTFVVQAITVDLPLFSSFLGYSALEISKLNVAVALGLIISCLVSGKVSDILALRQANKGAARILALMAGPVLIILSSFLLITLDLSSFKVFYAASFLFSFGGSWGFGTFYSILPELYDKNRLPIITGIAGGAGDMGMPAAPLLVGVIFGARGLWHLSWTVCIIMAAFSIIACLLLLPRTKHPRPR